MAFNIGLLILGVFSGYIEAIFIYAVGIVLWVSISTRHWLIIILI